MVSTPQISTDSLDAAGGAQPAGAPAAEALGAKASKSLGHWLVLGTAALGLAVWLVLALFVTPDERGYGTHEKLGLPACVSMKVLGVPCPGCGVPQI